MLARPHVDHRESTGFRFRRPPAWTDPTSAGPSWALLPPILTPVPQNPLRVAERRLASPSPVTHYQEFGGIFRRNGQIDAAVGAAGAWRGKRALCRCPATHTQWLVVIVGRRRDVAAAADFGQQIDRDAGGGAGSASDDGSTAWHLLRPGAKRPGSGPLKCLVWAAHERDLPRLSPRYPHRASPPHITTFGRPDSCGRRQRAPLGSMSTRLV